MLLPSQKPSSSYSLLKFVDVTSQLFKPFLSGAPPAKKNPGSTPEHVQQRFYSIHAVFLLYAKIEQAKETLCWQGEKVFSWLFLANMSIMFFE